MCGIAGILHFGALPDAARRVRPMADGLIHRGPDDEGFWSDNDCAFDDRGHGAANQEWMRTHHSAHRIIEIQVESYRGFLNEDPKLKPASREGSALRTGQPKLARQL